MRIATLCLVASAGACLAQEAQNDVFDRMLEHYSGLEGCTVTVGLKMTSEEPGLKEMLASMGQTSPGYVLKPNRFAFWNEEEPSGAMGMRMPLPELYSDGEQFIAAVESMEIYSEREAPESLSDLVASGAEEPNAAWKMLPGAPFVFALMSAEPRESLGTFLGPVEYKGVEGEGAEAYHVLATTQKEAEGQETKLELRVKAEGEPWLVSVKPDLSGSGAPAGLDVFMTFDSWEEAAEAPGQGEITPQESWEKVDDLATAVIQKMRGEDTTDASEDTGKPAPDFSLPLLGSEDRFSLADHKGKVVVLDFWATWCGPCVRALPTVTKITGEYAPKGVVFAAVNLQEDAEKVAEFMKNKGWSFTVPLDEEGSVADQFGVSAIPHSVVIDKKGVIRHVHVGFDPSTGEEELRKEIEALIAE